MRFVRLVLPILVMALVSCSGSTPTLIPPTAPPATVTPVPSQAPPTATFVPPSATASSGPSATVEPTDGPTPTAGPTATATPDPAIAVIYNYLAARAAADVAGVQALACQTFDAQAVTEAISFRSMNATLHDDLVCGVSGTDGAYTLVACTGTMTTTYGKESREWDLSNSIYQVTLEDGVLTMCGYHD